MSEGTAYTYATTNSNTAANVPNKVAVLTDPSSNVVQIMAIGDGTGSILTIYNGNLPVYDATSAGILSTISSNTTGIANATGQNTGNTYLSTLAGAVSSNKLQVNVTNSSIPVTGSFYQATQPVSLVSLPALAAGSNAIGSVTVSNFPSSTTVSGSVSVSNFPATQPISGTVAISNASIPVTGSFYPATQPVSIATMPTTPVTGTFYQATQPVSLVSLPALATGANTIGAISNTSFASTQSGTWNVGSSSAVGSAAPSNAFYMGIQGSSSNLTSINAASVNGDGYNGNNSAQVSPWIWNGASFDRLKAANAANNTTGTGLAGAGILAQYNTSTPSITSGNYNVLQLDSAGNLKVNVITGGSGGGGTQYSELTATTGATGTLSLGRYQSTLPTLTTGQMNEPMLDSSSRLYVNAPTATGSAVPANAFYVGMSDGSSNLQGLFALGKIGTAAVSINQILGVGNYIFNGSNADLMKSASAAANTTGTGLLGVGNLGFDGTNWQALGVTAANSSNPGTSGISLLTSGTGYTTATITLTSSSLSSNWYDMLNYPWLSLEILTNSSSATVAFQTSSDASETVNSSTVLAQANGQPESSMSSTGTVHGPRAGRWFRVTSNVSGASTVTLVLTFYTTQSASLFNLAVQNGTYSVNQSGTWQVGSNSTVGSAYPTTTFPIGIRDGSLNLQPLVSGQGIGDSGNGSQSASVSDTVYNGSTWDRQRSANAVANTSGTGLLGTGILGFDGTNYQAIKVKTNGTLLPSQTPTATVTSVAGAATTTQLLALNTSRTGAYFYNDSTSVAYLAFATSASTTAYTIQMAAQTFYEMPTIPVYTGAIFCIWATAAGSMRITEMA
jgi:hypothetical protein